MSSLTQDFDRVHDGDWALLVRLDLALVLAAIVDVQSWREKKRKKGKVNRQSQRLKGAPKPSRTKTPSKVTHTTLLFSFCLEQIMTPQPSMYERILYFDPHL